MLCVLLWTATLFAQSPGEVHSVYLLPMSSGFDQYLAQHITAKSVFPVVADPLLADAILTDHIGPRFEQRLDELYPPPPAEPKPEKKSESDKPQTYQEPPVRISAGPRGRGNFFLVDRRSRRVLWSAYERPSSMAPDDLDRAARRVVERLRSAVKGKQD